MDADLHSDVPTGAREAASAGSGLPWRRGRWTRHTGACSPASAAVESQDLCAGAAAASASAGGVFLESGDPPSHCSRFGTASLSRRWHRRCTQSVDADKDFALSEDAKHEMASSVSRCKSGEDVDLYMKGTDGSFGAAGGPFNLLPDDIEVASLHELQGQADGFEQSAGHMPQSSPDTPAERGRHPDAAVAEPLVTVDSLASWLASEDVLGALCSGFREEGFISIGSQMFLHAALGVTIEIDEGRMHVTIDSRSASDVAAFVDVAFDLSNFSGDRIACAKHFGKSIIDWARSGGSLAEDLAHEGAESTESEVEDCGVNRSLRLDWSLLPKPSELGASPGRRLRLLTYGRTTVRATPKADRHFCVDHKRIRYRLSGREAAKTSGLDEFIQARVCRCLLFHAWVSDLVRDVEASDLGTVAIFCWKGRHRSVAAAEILRKLYYPLAAIQHLSL